MPGVLGAIREPTVIAYSCSDKKLKLFREIEKEAANINNLRFVNVEELKNGEKYHALMHKRTDDLVAALHGNEDALNRLVKFQNQLTDNVVPVDNVKGVNSLIDREAMASCIENALKRTSNKVLKDNFRSLNWDVIPLNEHAPSLLSKFEYPIIMKRRLACGSVESHHMAVCYSLNEAISSILKMGDPQDDVNNEVFVQEYVPNHGGVLFKVYCIGEKVDIQARRSLSNKETQANYFDSQVLSKSGKILKTETVDSSGVKPLPREFARKMGEMMRRELDLSLLGIDVIFDIAKNKYCIIDVNYFPGYKGVKDASRAILTTALEKVERSRLLNETRIRSVPNWNIAAVVKAAAAQQQLCATIAAAVTISSTSAESSHHHQQNNQTSDAY